MKKKIFLQVIVLMFYSIARAQLPGDTAPAINTDVIPVDTIVKQNDADLGDVPTVKSYHSVINKLLSDNKFINLQQPPVYFITEHRQKKGKEFIFYILCIVVLVLGIFKTFYRSYFNNLFRVFFNTSLRQSQLTDQLLQAPLPSFILNIFFSITSGIFIWLLFTHHKYPTFISPAWLLPFCIVGIAVLYLAKYSILKFIGWVTGMQQSVDNYIFIIFLVNKIAGIVLIPFIVILAFSMPSLVTYFATIAVLVVVLFFLSRYFKTYAVLQSKLPMNAFHFVIYILATEVIPLLLLYKVTTDYFL